MNFTLTQNLTDERHLPWLGALLGALIATWVMIQSRGSINSDGVLYIEVAKLFDAGEWREGLSLYRWPFYSLLIAAVHKVSGLGFEPSAHSLDILFFALTTAGLMTLVREVGGDRLTMLAAGLLLFSSPNIVRSYLPMVLRDPGFWAFHVWSIVFFLRFYRSNAWKDAACWGIAAMAATLMRIEAISYLVMLPLVLLIQRNAIARIRMFLKAHILLLLVSAGLAAALFLHPSLSLQKLGRLGDPLSVAQSVYDQLAHGLSGKAQVFAENVLGKFLADYAMDGLLLTLAFALLAKAASSAGWLQLAFAVYARKFLGSGQAPKCQIVFAWLLVIGLVNATFIILSTFVLPKRYVMPIGFIILVYAAFGLTALYKAWREKAWRPIGKNWLFPLSAAAIAVQLGFILCSWSPHRSFESDAVKWVLAHARTGSRIYYDSGRLRYYANSEEPFNRDQATTEEIQQLFKSDQIRQYAYILVHVSKNRQELEQFITTQLGSPPTAVFDNGRGNRVLIYRVPN